MQTRRGGAPCKPSLAALLIGVLILLAPGAFAQSGDLAFPTLTGRVVDAAGLLRPDERAALESKLKEHEAKTSDQIVVATLRGLEGTSVEDYANRLYRHWKLGQSKTNNGVLFVVAPAERKVRIEVGYGLEGTLTDAVASVITRSAVVPRFKAGDWVGGINAGTDAIIGTLTGDAEEWQKRAKLRPDAESDFDPIVVFVILVIVLIVLSRLMRGAGGGGSRAHRRRGGGWILMPVPSSGGFGGGFSGGGFSGGGFSGGGGSSGGGGASGSW